MNWILNIVVGLLLITKRLNAIHTTDLFSYHDEDLIVLSKGDNVYELIRLDTRIYFYSSEYDHIYLNTNGILTFVTEFPDYINQPFPLEYPSIAAFYSNVDTTGSNQTSMIAFFKSTDRSKIHRASSFVWSSFTDSADFDPKVMYAATWENVGYYNAKNDRVNTFQTVILADQNQTFVIYLYPEDGLNWLQAEVGELGLPDVRAQAGFISEDGRYYTLDGSGTDNVRFLAEKSNIGLTGVWVYKVGQLDEFENVSEPNDLEVTTQYFEPNSCAFGGNKKCHLSAECMDVDSGFCCKCNPGYYGNGFNCLKNTIPIRVAGTLSGHIGDTPLPENFKLQSYVVTSDGRSYTAINPIEPAVGYKLQIVLPLGSAIGWLFAKPFGSGKNGYELTGGYLTHQATLYFRTSNDIFSVNQTFNGLNFWDQLSVNINVSGTLPDIPVGTKLMIRDFTEEYTVLWNGDLQSQANVKIEIPATGRIIEYDLKQTIQFNKCQFNDSVDTTVLQKISKLVLDFHHPEEAIRIGMLNKIGVDSQSNACTDGTANCGENTVCIPQEDDDYDCVCQNGYSPYQHENGIEHCTDIDECHGSNICDDNARCENFAGGYSCVCSNGYFGSGYECTATVNEVNRTETIENGPNFHDYAPQESHPHHHGHQTHHDHHGHHHIHYEPVGCQRCSERAICINGECICKEGWVGDGHHCLPACRSYETFINGECVSTYSEEDNELEPFCDIEGFCSCPHGYEFILLENICRLYIYADESTENSSKQDENILVPCDVDFNCHDNATCEWSESEYRHICVCPRGYQGDGITCNKIEVSCTTRPDLCDIHASCKYNEAMGKSQCQCDPGYEGDGFNCQLAPECTQDNHCGADAFCQNGVCLCLEGFERDISDFCVKAGTCGGAYCADNAICKLNPVTKVQFCECMEGYVGNGVTTCKSIPPPCNIRNTCGLYASCQPSYRDPILYECVCNPGFYGDGFVCAEERNCRNTPSLCDPNAKCINTAIGLQCVCEPGFLGNGSYCKEVSHHESGFLLISQGVVVIRVPFDGKLSRPISVAQMAIGVDKDCAEGRVYWGDISAKRIMSSLYNGSDSKPFVTDDILSPEGVAVDWISRRLYWTDSSKDTIEVASLDNPNQRAVIINKYLVNPRGIAVDPHKKKLYWSDWNREAPKIEVSELDGSNREVLLTKPGVILPNSLVVLNQSGELCYADAGTHKIECLDTYSKQLRTIAANLSYPFGLTNTEEHFYWTDWTTKQIESVDVYGNRKPGMQTPIFGSHKMYGMTAITESCPVFFSPCQIDNGGCSADRLCLINENSGSGKSCVCIRSSLDCHNEILLDNQF